MKQIDVGPCFLDLFITTPLAWGYILALRTGDAAFSRKIVTAKRDGGFLPGYLKATEGRIMWGKVALDTGEEEDLFVKILGMDWIHPRERIGQR